MQAFAIDSRYSEMATNGRRMDSESRAAGTSPACAQRHVGVNARPRVARLSTATTPTEASPVLGFPCHCVRQNAPTRQTGDCPISRVSLSPAALANRRRAMFGRMSPQAATEGKHVVAAANSSIIIQRVCVVTARIAWTARSSPNAFHTFLMQH